MILIFMIQITNIFRRVTRWVLAIDTSFADGGRVIPAAVLV
jgi:hypothetical protein